MNNNQYSVIEDIFDDSYNTKHNEKFKQKHNEFKPFTTIYNEVKSYDREKPRPKYNESVNILKYNNEISCRDSLRHIYECEICKSYITKDTKFYQFVICVMLIIIIILLKQYIK